MSLLKKSKLSGYYLRYVSYGYILKNTEAVKLIEALRDLRKGGSPKSNNSPKSGECFSAAGDYKDAKENLSDPEWETLHWLSKGFSYKEISEKLFISVETVRTPYP